MRTFIVSMSLFAMVVAYVIMRSPVNKAESMDSSIAHKGKTEKEKAEQSSRQPKKASTEEWAAFMP